MKIITRSYGEDGNAVLSAPIPANSLRNVWDGDTCTVYEEGDIIPLVPDEQYDTSPTFE